MHIRSSALAAVSILSLTSQLTAQDQVAKILADPTINLSKPADRADVVARIAEIETAQLQNARNRATQLGLPLRSELPNGRVREIAGFHPDGRPLYHITYNANAAISTGANLLRNSPYSLNGSGVTIGIWDGGSVRSTHQEFGGRITVKDGASPNAHATHVGGTMIAAGVVASARGMANSATIHSYDWNYDDSEMAARAATFPGEANTIYLSNHSYGYISGWTYVGGGSPYRDWEWYGSGTTASGTETDFGRYNTYSQTEDAVAYNAPYYLIFRAAGNDSNDDPSPGDKVCLTPGGSSVVNYSSASHPAGDGIYRNGFETIGFKGLAKNILTIGAATDAVTSGQRDHTKAFLTSFSSCGPTDDGRIKPDLVANGDNLYSPISSSNTSYEAYSGTSMASPNACGSAALLIQQYGNLFPGQAMRASTLKGLLIHTADDRGNPGPDYKFGWGLMNVKAAADVIDEHFNNEAKQRITENTLTTSDTTQAISFIWDGQSPIRATLCWTDPAGAPTNESDSRTPRLVNNLDLKLIAPNGSEYRPFVMPFVGTWTTASMASPATTGVNKTDNVEQVLLAAPPVAGTYEAVISYSGSLTNSSQTYSLILTGSTADEPPPPPLSLSAVSPNSSYATPVTTYLSGKGFRADTSVKLTRTGHSDITATNVQLVSRTLRCNFNLTGAAAGAWNVVVTNPDQETFTLANAFTVVGTIWTEAFDSSVNGWSSTVTTGSNSWSLTTEQSQSPSKSYFAPGPGTRTTTNLVSPSIAIPAGSTNLELKFWHSYNLEASPSPYDAAKLELSIDNGGSWFDVENSNSGASFASNGYNSTINSTATNDFAGQRAWSGNSSGFIQTAINLSTTKFAGRTMRIRWRIATDSSVPSPGWYVDSVVLSGTVPNQAPKIFSTAVVSMTGVEVDPVTSIPYQVVPYNESAVKVTATDDSGESNLTYHWSVTSGAPVTFSPNDSNSAKNSIAIFQAAGDYQLTISVSDNQGLLAVNSMNVRVSQTAKDLLVTPPVATLPVGSNQTFGATVVDQFGAPMPNQPGSFTWSTNGGGTIDSTGKFTATTAGGPFVISATSGAFSNIANVSVTPTPATVTLGNLNQTFDGSPKPITVTTDPGGLAVDVTYDGSSTAPTNAGSYAVEANITDPNYQGSATATLVIEPGNTLAVWKNEHFSETEQNAGLADASADPDGDGIPNLAEYALGSHPREFTQPVVATLDGTGLYLVFTRPAGLPDVTYAAESSDSLGNWSPIPLEVIQEGDPETVRARDPLTTGDPTKRFLRLKFGQP